MLSDGTKRARPLGTSPDTLIKAALDGDFTVVRRMLQDRETMRIAQQDNNGWTVVHHVSYSGLDKMLLELFAGASDADKKEAVTHTTWLGETPLHLACRAQPDNSTVVQILLSWGADPNKKTNDDNTPLHFACERKGNIKVVRLLRDMGADMFLDNRNFDLPLTLAVREKDAEIVSYMLKNGNWNSRIAQIMLAIMVIPHTSSEIAEMLLSCLPLDKCKFFLSSSYGNMSRGTSLSDCRRLVALVFKRGVRFGINDTWPKTARINLEDIETILKYMHPDDFHEGFVVQVFCSFHVFRCANQTPGCFSEVLEMLLRHSGKLKKYVSINAEFPNNTSVKCVNHDFDLKHAPLLFRYFPERHRSFGSLQQMCRPVLRKVINDIFDDPWKGYCYLKDGSLPIGIRKYLLYEMNF